MEGHENFSKAVVARAKTCKNLQKPAKTGKRLRNYEGPEF
jgi:hypothetical protein